MHKILILFALVFVALIKVNVLSAQPYQVDDLKQWQIKGYAKSAAEQGDIYSAVYYYQYLVRKYPKKNAYLWSLAMQQQKARNYQQAYILFDQLMHRSKKKYALCVYYKAINAKSLGAYDEAYELFKSIKKRRYKRALYARVVDEMEGCLLALDMQDSLINRDVTRLNNSINKSHIEFNPFYLNDSLIVYGSSGMDSIQYFTSDLDVPKRKFYLAEKKNDTWQGGSEPAAPFFNSGEYDTGDGVFSLDGNRFYFTRCTKNWKNKMVCHLWVTEREGDNWTEPVELGNEINIKDYTSTEPTVGTCYDPDLEVIYFISDRPEGQGGMDIWYTVYDVVNHSYEQPINAGVFVNTSEDEVTPFYDKYKHRLFFSSNGWPGLGALDVFYAKGDLVNWEEPVNVGYPINSSCDDVYYTENQLGNQGFLASNRPGGEALTHATCCDDLYEWEQSEIEKVWVKGTLEGREIAFDHVFSSTSQGEAEDVKYTVLDSARVNLYLKNDSSDLLYISNQLTRSDGGFEFLVPKGFDYEVFVDDGRVLNKKLTFSTRDVKPKDSKIELKPVLVKTISKNPLVMSNIYYEYGKADLLEESQRVIDETLLKLMNEYQDLLVEIRSHTDNKGDARYNLRLSKQRSKSVVDYLIAKGIEAYRLKAIGFGETLPVAQNEFPDGKDNPEGRALNRRTEFRLVNNSEMKK